MYNLFMDTKEHFKIWINGKYDAWSQLQPRENRTITKFAIFIGAGRKTVEKWLSQGSIPEVEQISLLARIYPDVLVLFDLIGPPGTLSHALSVLSPSELKEFTIAWNAVLSEISSTGTKLGTPEGDEIATKVLRKYGLDKS